MIYLNRSAVTGLRTGTEIQMTLGALYMPDDEYSTVHVPFKI